MLTKGQEYARIQYRRDLLTHACLGPGALAPRRALMNRYASLRSIRIGALQGSRRPVESMRTRFTLRSMNGARTQHVACFYTQGTATKS